MAWTLPPEADESLRLGAALKRLAQDHKLETRSGDSGSLCLRTSIGDICALAVPFRSEIEVWLATETAGEPFNYPLSSLQAAVGRDNHGFMYSSGSLEATISQLCDFFSDFLAQLSQDPERVKENVKSAYDIMVSESLLSEKRNRAEKLWQSGDMKAAADLYEALPCLSNIERKRLEMVRSGKLR